MKIYGIEKLSLVDFDGELACVLFTAGCNLRCPYCHNSSLVIGKDICEINKKEVFDFLDKRKNILTAIVVSGGEPTLNTDLPFFMKELRRFGLKIKLDTNGTNPDMLQNIIDNCLADYVAMDVKSSPEGYVEQFGASPELVSKIEKSVEILKKNTIPYEFRCTLSHETASNEVIEKMAKWLAGANKLYLQKFEDVGTNLQSNLTEVNKERAIAYSKILEKHVKNCKLRGY